MAITMKQLSDKDKRALVLGAVGVGLILAYFSIVPWFDRWSQTRADLKKLRADVAAVGAESAIEGSVVKFEMPKNEKEQSKLFRDALNQQIQKAGIKVTSFVPLKTSKASGELKMLKIQCQAKCAYNQLVDLMAGLYENPYIVGIEEFSMTSNEKDKKTIEFKLIVSSFAK